LLTAAKSNFDVEYIGFVGVILGSNNSFGKELQLASASVVNLRPTAIEDVGNYLGVKKRVQRFDYKSDFDVNGLLFWIGTNETLAAWTNPITTGQVTLTTSHGMYSVGMRLEEILSREGGTSCYWGGSCPQFFILDLKHRRFRCNYFTLRHGYQAANSYIQNWTFSASQDGANWVILFEGAETPFFKAFDTKSWPTLDAQEYFRYFRVLQKGNYSMGKGSPTPGSAYLCLAGRVGLNIGLRCQGFEMYGELLRD
jgi:hypothetical protein